MEWYGEYNWEHVLGFRFPSSFWGLRLQRTWDRTLYSCLTHSGTSQLKLKGGQVAVDKSEASPCENSAGSHERGGTGHPRSCTQPQGMGRLKGEEHGADDIPVSVVPTGTMAQASACCHPSLCCEWGDAGRCLPRPHPRPLHHTPCGRSMK